MGKTLAQEDTLDIKPKSKFDELKSFGKSQVNKIQKGIKDNLDNLGLTKKDELSQGSESDSDDENENIEEFNENELQYC